MDAIPTTVWQGLIAGLGNPVIGLEHLAALLAVGSLAAAQPKGGLMVIGFVIASIVGAAAHIGEATVANADVYVALAVVLLGLLMFRATPLRRDLLLALFVAAGLVGGYALGKPIALADRAPILAYFVSLAAIQTAIALAVLYGIRWLMPRAALHLLTTRVVGAFAVGAGAAILLRRYGAGA